MTEHPDDAPNAVSDVDLALEPLMSQARACFERGEYDGAIDFCAQALATRPAYNPAHMLMARSRMPGESYRVVMGRIHAALQPRTYVEIGVAKGRSMALAGAQTRAVGIDPKPRIEVSIAARSRLYPIPSDEFFARWHLPTELGDDSLDLAFIDGLHLFEQTFRDFINVERFSTPDTVVLVHDCNPATGLGAARERATAYWAGDVWKLVPCLREARPDLSVQVIPSFPSGLAIITNLDSGSTVLSEQYDDLVARYRPLDFSVFEDNRDELLNIVANDWDAIRQLLPRTARASGS